MEKDLLEIRFHGRGGQGAKTAALLFGDSVLGKGTHIQAFPEYGPERMGAPVQSFVRISKSPISRHCAVTEPKIVVVLDPSLMSSVDMTAGLPQEGMIIVNTAESAAEMRKQLKLSGRKVYVVDASKISRETIGREIPNTPMLGALVKVSNLIPYDQMIQSIKEKLNKKFKGRTEIINGNLKAIERAYQEVKSE